MNYPKMEQKQVIEIKKLHLIIALVTALGAPAVAGISSYYKALSELAPRADVDKMRDKIDRIAEDVAEIKGYMKRASNR